MAATDGGRVYTDMQPDPKGDGYEADARRHRRLRVLAVLLFALFLALSLAFAPQVSDEDERGKIDEVRQNLQSVPMDGEQDGSKQDNP